MNMNQRQLRMFTVLAKEGHFSRASAQLHISQPALTRSIQELELQLGVSLFSRTTRQLTLSDEGKRFLPMAQRLLSDMEQIAYELRSHATGMRGTVTVALGTAFGTVLMPSVLKSFQQACPHVQVRLVDDNSGGITGRVLRAEADFGIGSPLGDTAALRLDRLASAPIGLLAHPDHFELNARMTPAQLAKLPLLRESDDTSIMNMLRTKGSNLVGQMHRGIEVSSLAMQLAFVRAGLGVAVLSALGASHALACDLSFRPLKPAIDRELFLMTQRSRVLSAPAKALITALHETLDQSTQLGLPLHTLVRLHPRKQ